MQERSRNWFVTTAAAVLLATGLAKVWSSFGQARVLAAMDPILGLGFGKLMLLVGGIEIAIAILCLLPLVAPNLKLGLLAWMATNFLVYRIGLWCVGWHHPCGCMGSLAGALHLSDGVADQVMKGVLIYLLVGSYFLLLKYRLAGQMAVPAAHLADRPRT